MPARKTLLKTYGFAVATAVATWLLLVIGGTVNPTGSSMACPDWYFVPTCHGEIWPEDWSGGVLFEHGHRLWASLVGMMTVVLGVLLWRHGSVDRATGWMGLGAILLVAFQGTLGGITVLVGLSAAISTVHLLLANLFFSLIILLAARARAQIMPLAQRGPCLDRRLVVVAFVLVLGQILLGGAVRHLGAGLACGNDWLGCGPAGFWPALGEAQLHMLHRFAGFVVVLAVAWTSLVTAKDASSAGRPVIARLAWVPTGLVGFQALLGLTTVATGRSLVLVTLHTATAGLVLASLVLVWVAVGPLFGADQGAEASSEAT